FHVTGVQTCALPISSLRRRPTPGRRVRRARAWKRRARRPTTRCRPGVRSDPGVRGGRETGARRSFRRPEAGRRRTVSSVEDGPEGAVPATDVKAPAPHVTVTSPVATGRAGGG